MLRLLSRPLPQKETPLLLPEELIYVLCRLLYDEFDDGEEEEADNEDCARFYPKHMLHILRLASCCHSLLVIIEAFCGVSARFMRDNICRPDCNGILTVLCESDSNCTKRVCTRCCHSCDMWGAYCREHSDLFNNCSRCDYTRCVHCHLPGRFECERCECLLCFVCKVECDRCRRSLCSDDIAEHQRACMYGQIISDTTSDSEEDEPIYLPP
jgi:hypothetical protein